MICTKCGGARMRDTDEPGRWECIDCVQPKQTLGGSSADELHWKARALKAEARVEELFQQIFSFPKGEGNT